MQAWWLQSSASSAASAAAPAAIVSHRATQPGPTMPSTELQSFVAAQASTGARTCRHGRGMSAMPPRQERHLRTLPVVRVASLEPVAESKACSSPAAPPASSTAPSGVAPRRPFADPAVHPGIRNVAAWAFVATSQTMTRPSPDLLATRPPGSATRLSTRLPWPAGAVGNAAASLLGAAAVAATAASAASACTEQSQGMQARQ